MSYSREHWSSKIGFIFAAIGSAVGLGLLWKFPYIVGQNGGGLFLLTYLICIIVIGVPIFIGELILGRATQRAAVGSFQVLDPKQKGWKVAGWLGVLSSFLIMSYYSVIAGWGMSYVVMSLNGFYKGLTIQEVSKVYDELAASGGISMLWHFLFTAITMGIVLGGVRKGIEYWSKLMTRALLILLFLLFLYGTGLKGFSEAFHFVFYPDVSKFNLSSVIEALGLAFFTLSLGQGIMISYGSYMKKEDRIPNMAALVGFSVIIVAVLVSLTIFPVVFSFGLQPSAGPGLVFKTLPFLFAHLPGAMVLSTVFFIVFVFTALTSAIPLIEVVATNLMELYNLTRTKAVVIVASATFALGIPSAFAGSQSIFPEWTAIYGSDFLQTMDNLVSIWVIPLAGLLTSIFIGWVMDKRVCRAHFTNEGLAWIWGYRIWRFFIKWLAPITILIIITQKSGIIDLNHILTLTK